MKLRTTFLREDDPRSIFILYSAKSLQTLGWGDGEAAKANPYQSPATLWKRPKKEPPTMTQIVSDFCGRDWLGSTNFTFCGAWVTESHNPSNETDALVARIKKIDLSNSKKDIIELGNEDVQISEEECSRSLFGKIIGKRKASLIGIRRTVTAIWQISNQLEKKVLNGVNWIFENQFFILREWEEGLSVNHPGTEVGMKVGCIFKKTKNVTVIKPGGTRGSYLRLLVTVDVSKPLPRCVHLKLNNQLIVVGFQYERLLSMCYYCGMLGHLDKNYTARLEDIANGNPKEGQFGEWLRAAEGKYGGIIPSSNQPSSQQRDCPPLAAEAPYQSSGKENTQPSPGSKNSQLSARNQDNSLSQEGMNSDSLLIHINKQKTLIAKNPKHNTEKEPTLRKMRNLRKNQSHNQMPASNKRMKNKMEEAEEASLNGPTFPNEHIGMELANKVCREDQWRYLERASTKWGHDWVIGGDWNETLHPSEKKGGKMRTARELNGFQDFCARMSMHDISMEGHKFTWENKRAEEGYIEERLDRFFSSYRWMAKHPRARVLNIFRGASDHYMLILQEEPGQYLHKKKRFYFDKRWLKVEGVKDVVKAAWEIPKSGTPMHQVAEKIKEVRVSLLKWSSGFRKEQDEWISRKKELKIEHKKEAEYWSQKARLNWLQEGDTNSKYFHSVTLQKRQTNKIAGLKNEEGNWCETQQEIEECISSYFNTMFTSEGSYEDEHILQNLTQVITDDINKRLIAMGEATSPVSEEEITEALFSMNPLKAPGQDDDALIFSKAEVNQAYTLLNGLHRYKLFTGQKVNLSKSSVFFSKNTNVNVRTEICQILDGIKVQTSTRSRLVSWKNRFLSTAGKEILLKSVINAMPIFTMSYFYLPKGIFQVLQSLSASFWWSKGDNMQPGMHWKKWNAITIPKQDGGLGFHDILLFNEALILKQIWRVATKPNLLVSKVLKGKYFPSTSILKAGTPQNASWMWRNWMKVLDKHKAAFKVNIRNGRNTTIWNDPWIPRHPTGFPTPQGATACNFNWVEELMSNEGRSWDEDKLKALFNAEDVERMKSINSLNPSMNDKWSCTYDKKGILTVATTYSYLIQNKLRDMDIAECSYSMEMNRKPRRRSWKLHH
ncbi:RNA-directed DNA polymerase (reversetranscriptase)-related family protein [Striga asiatica]|uniref:RNA-directed DNA polymerase (Reversetranscriptase)-related family protein n=1 Tax=Striga asiatica TaxID=4170 RepID=A0A5A7PWU2_STRAF|nr:RNA-directed DNA polymerase (reversetranscriptase)-related family protein [Striga asiatica]